MTVDVSEFQRQMTEQKERSRTATRAKRLAGYILLPSSTYLLISSEQHSLWTPSLNTLDPPSHPPTPTLLYSWTLAQPTFTNRYSSPYNYHTPLTIPYCMIPNLTLTQPNPPNLTIPYCMIPNLTLTSPFPTPLYDDYRSYCIDLRCGTNRLSCQRGHGETHRWCI